MPLTYDGLGGYSDPFIQPRKLNSDVVIARWTL